MKNLIREFSVIAESNGSAFSPAFVWQFSLAEEWIGKRVTVRVFSGDKTANIGSLVEGLPDDELRTLRAIINGKLSKRVITPEQQAKMQAARQKVI